MYIYIIHAICIHIYIYIYSMYIPKPDTPVAFKLTRHGLSSSAGDVTGDVGNGISWDFNLVGG